MKKILYGVIAMVLITVTVNAQQADIKEKDKHMYFTAGGNGGIISFSSVKDNNNRVTSIPRFTLFFNVGANFNYDVSDHAGFFTGLNIKNIGLITKVDSVKLKRRVYTVGIPIGFKLGNLREGTFFFGGAELDMAMNYKEKLFIGGDKKSKFNEWFSDRTDRFMPSLFAGVQVNKNFSFKAQYYLNNFFNQGYRDGSGVKVYQHTDAKVFFLTFGYSFYNRAYPTVKIKAKRDRVKNG